MRPRTRLCNLSLFIDYLPTSGEDALFPPGFQFCNPKHGVLPRFGIIWKTTTTDQAITLAAGIRKHAMDFGRHHSGCATQFGKLI